jgi:Tfp pilus assembly protein PilF
LGEHKKAMSHFQKAIEIDPNYATAHSNLGKILGELNHVNEAKKYFEKSLNLDPNREKTCEDYGDLLLKLNQHKKALEYFKKGTGFIQFTQKDFKII